MRFQKTGTIFTVAASILLIASLALTGCSGPEATDTATSTDSSTTVETMPASGTETAVLTVNGMTCSACSGAVQQALTEVDGVESADVALDTNEATIQYDPTRTNPDMLVQVVDGAQGMSDYSATVK